MLMHKFSYYLKQIPGWILAALIAVILCDLACFAFYNPFSELSRKHGSTTGFLLPGSIGTYGLEGYCITRIDERGYVNRDLPIADDYYVVAGASHTEGLFIPTHLRYSDLANDTLYNDGKNHMINIGKSGNYYSVVLQHLDGILGEFPDAEGIIIETDSLAYDTKALYDSQIQAGFDPAETADALMSSLGTKQKAVMKIKQGLPLLRLLHKQYYTYLESRASDTEGSDILDPEFWKSEYEGDFEIALDDLMQFIRNKTDKKIIILYHPAVKLEADGTMSIMTNNAEDYYKKVCPKYDITFIDMTYRFEEAYNNDHVIPYGFFNTTMGSGHINRKAHEMMAEELEKVLR